METKALLILAMIGALILLIAIAVKGEMENLLTFLLRGLAGVLGIHLVNFFLTKKKKKKKKKINAITFLTTAFLGIPGFLGLYALGIYRLT